MQTLPARTRSDIEHELAVVKFIRACCFPQQQQQQFLVEILYLFKHILNQIPENTFTIIITAFQNHCQTTAHKIQRRLQEHSFIKLLTESQPASKQSKPVLLLNAC